MLDDWSACLCVCVFVEIPFALTVRGGMSWGKAGQQRNKDAKNKKLRYLYLSAGYEVASKYKADYKGFEWWTGSNWSKDKELYRKSCDADSRIQTIKDLADYETNWMKAVQTDK